MLIILLADGVGENSNPENDLARIFDTLADWEKQLEPIRHELERLEP